MQQWAGQLRRDGAWYGRHRHAPAAYVHGCHTWIFWLSQQPIKSALDSGCPDAFNGNRVGNETAGQDAAAR